ncbi:hypothetical protein Q664_08585 [Archangium violaceum Cb vi76]|uniref:Uncharacterized protein n=2 Tax=Archangium violaceum TaxID=83451 RepID=A0A084SYH4_9BACT|nr:hypothetical protein Q664_08585 [Archangium violaceum Cb vi76]
MTIAALALGQAACVANQGDAPFRFLDARALSVEDDACVPSDELVIGSGLLDLSGSRNYLLAMSVETNNSTQPIVINQEPFSGPGLSDITVNEFVYSYEYVPSGGGAAANLIDTQEESTAVYRVLRPGTDPDQSYVFMNAFGPKGSAALEGKDGVVFSTIKARGRMSGGQVVESNKFTFPIRVYSSGATYDCADDQIPAGACVVGQDVAVGGDDDACVDPT